MMALRPNISIRTTPQARPPLPEKQILRPPCYPGERDLSVFPNIGGLNTRRSNSNPYELLMNVFSETVSNALKRVLIIDRYFFKPYDGENLKDRLEQLYKWIEGDYFQATEIKIISECGGKNEDQQQLKNDLRSYASDFNDIYRLGRTQHPLSLEFKILPDDMVHDRFAIIDDELWHFGGTVGGFEKQFSVASRGWSAIDYGADELFYELWRMENRK